MTDLRKFYGILRSMGAWRGMGRAARRATSELTGQRRANRFPGTARR